MNSVGFVISEGENCAMGPKDVASVTQSFVQQKFYYSEKGIKKASDRHQKGAKCAPLTSLGGVLYNFSICYQQ